MKKRIITFILSIVMMFPAVLTAGAADNDSFMNSLGVSMEAYNNKVTRGEFAAIAARLLNLNVDYNAAVSNFADVTEYIGEINAVAGVSLMYGEGNNFHPDYFVKVNDAAQCFLDAAGYKNLANGDYMNLARANGIAPSGADSDSSITFAQLNDIIENFMKMDYMEATYEGSKVIYTSKGDVFEKLLKLTRVKGKITGNENGTLLGESTLNNALVIDDTTYLDKKMAYQNLLGYNVTAYVRETDDGKEVIYLYPTDKNNEITISADDLLSSTKNQIEYKTDNKKVKKLKIDERADLIYNGSAKTKWNDDDISLTRGTLKLLDNNADGKYDVIFAVTYYVIWVDGINPAKSTVRNKFDGKDYEFKESGNDFQIYQGGRKMSFSDIAADSILSVYESGNTKGDKKIKIDISINTARGSVTAKDDKSIRVDDQVYKLDKEYTSKIVAGSYGTFYLDCESRVVAYSDKFNDLSDKNDKYVFLCSASVSLENGEDEVYFRYITIKGQKETKKLKKKVKVRCGDQAENMDSANILDNPKFKQNGKFVPQLIMFETDLSGDISCIYTAYDSCRNANYGRTPGVFSLDIKMNDDGELNRTYYRTDWNQVRNETDKNEYLASCYITSDTTLLQLPRKILSGGDFDEDDIIIRQEYFANSDERDLGYEPIKGVQKYFASDGMIYDCDECNVASVIVVWKDETRDSQKNSMWIKEYDQLIVRSAPYQKINDDGDIEYMIDSTWSFRGDISWKLVGNAIEDLKDCRPGDIIRFAGNTNALTIHDAQTVFSYEGTAAGAINMTSYSNKNYRNDDFGAMSALTTPDEIRNNVILCSEGFNIPQTFMIYSYTNVWVMDCRNGITVTKGDMSDIHKGTPMYMNIRGHIPRDVVVIID